MIERSATHATFTIERNYDATPARVFSAWSRREEKSQWFACHGEWNTTLHEMDFRVGGSERLNTSDTEGVVHGFIGLYHDIVPDERIVYSYGMHLDERRISVSLVTIEFRPEGRGTRLVFTEQGAFLDGYDEIADRELGTKAGLDNLGAFLEPQRKAS
jgi:uncharacterized protein YndB with AHSA1/START domain